MWLAAGLAYSVAMQVYTATSGGAALKRLALKRLVVSMVDVRPPPYHVTP